VHNSRRGPDPVFVDRTGRRRRLFAIAGSAGGLVLLLAAVALFAAFTGDGPGPIPGWPAGAGHARPAASRAVPGAPNASGTAAPGPLPTPQYAPAAAAQATTGPTQTTAPAGTTAPAPVISPTPTQARTSRGQGVSRSPTPHPTKSR
jgi:hypothetical protein